MLSKPKYAIVDESLPEIGLQRCELFVEFDNCDISYAVIQPKQNKFLAFKNYQANDFKQLAEIFANDGILLFDSFLKIKFSIVNVQSTLVPSAFYEAQKNAELLAFNHQIGSADSIAKDDFGFFDAKHVFAVNDDLINFAVNQLKQVHINHCGTAFIEHGLLKNRNKAQRAISVNVHKHQFEMMVIAENQLLFYNNFYYNTAEDFIYFIMLVYEQLNLNPEEDVLEITGLIEKQSAIFSISKKYIRYVDLAMRQQAFQFSYGFEQLPAWQFQTLFSLGLCV
ncbi:MAG: DUF3822 family protein [Bacteroidia bacterium]|nr:DUF3822 family protein [Bacteroidia bacterium]